MERTTIHDTSNHVQQISVHDFFKKTRYIINYIKSKWLLLLACTIVGAVLGLAYSLMSKPKYTAVSSFVLDDGDRNTLGQYASLASLAGIDVGGASSSIFKGDNILELYKSRAMLEKALLTKANFNGKDQKLIGRYIAFNNLQEKWKKNDNLSSVNFNGDPEKFNRKQDSLITDIVEAFNKNALDVSKPDKKLSIIKVSFTAKDELFAKVFTDILVNNVNDFYVQTKTKKTVENVDILQHQADSVKRSLNSSIGGVALAIDAAPNANPAMLSLRVPSQRKQVDVQANTAIYSEIIKNLEIAKISLRQQKPLIQFVDQPVLPLIVTHTSKTKGITTGAFLGFFLMLFALLVRRLWRSVYNSSI